MSNRRLFESWVVACYGGLLAVHLGVMVAQLLSERVHWTELALIAMEAIPVIAAAGFLFFNSRRCKSLLRIFAVLSLPMIALSPLAQHAIDRTPFFWTIWSLWLVSTLLVIIPLYPTHRERQRN